MRSIILVVCFFLMTTVLLGQVPSISSVQKVNTFPSVKVVITGTGFSSTASDLVVWFGNVKGNIISSTESTIVATVPPQARLSSVEVINLVSKRSGRSAIKLVPVFSGNQPFTNSFTTSSFTNADDIFDICTGDLDGDGKTDIVGSKFKDGMSNLMLLKNTSTVSANNTAMSFTQSSIALAFPSFSVACGDINGDGKPEIIASRGGTTTGNSIFIFPNTSTVGTISFGSMVQLDLTVGDFAKEIAIRDLDRDGRPEIIVTNGQTSTIYIFQNNITGGSITSGSFARIDKSVTGTLNTLALDVADFNGDGWPDIAVSPNTNATKVYILVNPANSSLNFTSISNFVVGGTLNINDLASADFNSDGLLDFAIADRGNNKAFIYLNKGSSLFQSVNSTTGFNASVAWGVDVADMNGDGHVDFVVGNRDFTTPQINVFINDGAATPNFTANTITSAKANWFVRVGDYDGDSKPDIAATSTNNSSSFSIDVYKNRNCHKPNILNSDPVTVCNGQVIPLEAVSLQGVAYTWSTGDSGPTSNIDITDVGTITLTAVGEGGSCSVQSTITVAAGIGSAPATPTITAPNGVCAGGTLTLSTPSAADIYFWSGPNSFSSGAQNPPGITNATLVNGGIYSLRVKVGDCLSDVATKTIQVVEPSSFIIASTVTNGNVCQGQPVTLSVNPVANYNYQWKKDGSTLSGKTSPSLAITAASVGDEGSYTLFVSHQTITCTSETSAYALNMFTAPNATFTISPAQVCVGTLVAFNGSASTFDNTATSSFAWNFGDAANGTGSTATHTYTASSASINTSLTISYTGVANCASIFNASFPVHAANAPSIVVDPVVTEICPDGSETIALTVPELFTTYTWNTDQTGDNISISEPGTYSVTTTDANGCSGSAEIIFTGKAGCEPPVISGIPKVFTPNGDNVNEYWTIEGFKDNLNCELNLFDGRGRRVYNVKASGFPDNGWDGTANGKALPDGTYYYVIGCPNAKPVTGSVLIVR